MKSERAFETRIFDAKARFGLDFSLSSNIAGKLAGPLGTLSILRNAVANLQQKISLILRAGPENRTAQQARKNPDQKISLGLSRGVGFIRSSKCYCFAGRLRFFGLGQGKYAKS